MPSRLCERDRVRHRHAVKSSSTPHIIRFRTGTDLATFTKKTSQHWEREWEVFNKPQDIHHDSQDDIHCMWSWGHLLDPCLVGSLLAHFTTTVGHTVMTLGHMLPYCDRIRDCPHWHPMGREMRFGVDMPKCTRHTLFSLSYCTLCVQ